MPTYLSADNLDRSWASTKQFLEETTMLDDDNETETSIEAPAVYCSTDISSPRKRAAIETEDAAGSAKRLRIGVGETTDFGFDLGCQSTIVESTDYEVLSLFEDFEDLEDTDTSLILPSSPPLLSSQLLNSEEEDLQRVIKLSLADQAPTKPDDISTSQSSSSFSSVHSFNPWDPFNIRQASHNIQQPDEWVEGPTIDVFASHLRGFLTSSGIQHVFIPPTYTRDIMNIIKAHGQVDEAMIQQYKLSYEEGKNDISVPPRRILAVLNQGILDCEESKWIPLHWVVYEIDCCQEDVIVWDSLRLPVDLTEVAEVLRVMGLCWPEIAAIEWKLGTDTDSGLGPAQDRADCGVFACRNLMYRALALRISTDALWLGDRLGDVREFRTFMADLFAGRCIIGGKDTAVTVRDQAHGIVLDQRKLLGMVVTVVEEADEEDSTDSEQGICNTILGNKEEVVIKGDDFLTDFFLNT